MTRDSRHRFRTAQALVATVVALLAASVVTGQPASAARPALHAGMMPADSPDARHAGAREAGAREAGARTPTGAPAAARGATGAPLGVDVSSYQHPSAGPIAWPKVFAGGQAFAIVKATEAGYTNPWFTADIAGAHAAGLVVGAYAFAHPELDPVVQADAFARTIGVLPSPALPPVLDLETTGNLSPASLSTWAHAFLSRLTADTGVLPMVYSGPWFWSTAMAGDTGFSSYPLWEASYTADPAPQAMGGWSAYRLWQWTDAASVPGISGGVDQSRYGGSISQLFGTTPTPIDLAYAALGGPAGLLGAPTGSETLADAPGARLRPYQYGTIYWSPTTGAHEVHGALLAAYQALGGSVSVLGLPTSDEVAVTGGRSNSFTSGAMFWSGTTGAHEVNGGIAEHYQALGGPAGPLGLPTADEADAPGPAGSRVSVFQIGRIYWSPNTGAQAVLGAILAEYDALGGPAGPFGLPVTDETAAPGSRQSLFQGGEVLWSPSSGAHEVHGLIRVAYDALGGAGSTLGLPIADETAAAGAGGGRVSTFQAGQIYWSGSTAAHPVSGALLARYLQDGGAAVYGLPVGDPTPTARGLRQRFTAVVIYYNSVTGATTVLHL